MLRHRNECLRICWVKVVLGLWPMSAFFRRWLPEENKSQSTFSCLWQSWLIEKMKWVKITFRKDRMSLTFSFAHSGWTNGTSTSTDLYWGTSCWISSGFTRISAEINEKTSRHFLAKWKVKDEKRNDLYLFDYDNLDLNNNNVCLNWKKNFSKYFSTNFNVFSALINAE